MSADFIWMRARALEAENSDGVCELGVSEPSALLGVGQDDILAQGERDWNGEQKSLCACHL